MALTNQQYESIMRGYEQTATKNRHILEARRRQVYDSIPEYEALEDSVASASVSHVRRMLESGRNEGTLPLHEQLKELAARKAALLTAHGFPSDYLQPVYDCPDCRDTGYRDGEKCHCFRRQEIALLYEQSNIRQVISRENFSTLSYEYYEGEDLERFRHAVRVCTSFTEEFHLAEGRQHTNLFLYGTVGTGKSFLSGCIAHDLLQKGSSVLYFGAAPLFDTMARYSFDSKEKESLYNFCKDLYNVDLVIVDDLGTELTNSFVASTLFTLLNERIMRGRSTVISTNLSLEELKNRYSDRIFSRIISNFTFVKLSGPDIRMYKKRLSNRK